MLNQPDILLRVQMMSLQVTRKVTAQITVKNEHEWNCFSYGVGTSAQNLKEVRLYFFGAPACSRSPMTLDLGPI